MDLNEYQKLAEKTAKKDFKTKEEEIMCWGLGVVGEAGNIGSCIKKLLLTKKTLKKELKKTSEICYGILQ